MFFSAIDNRLYTPWDIGRRIGMEVIGSLGEYSELPEFKNHSSALPGLPAENAIMDMLGMLDLMQAEKGRVVLVTSPSKNEGKTTVALQAAMALAQDKRARTLLIDADFKHPDLSAKFDLTCKDFSKTDLKETAPSRPPRKGMVDVLVGDVGINDVICPLNNDNFDIVYAGSDQRRQQVGFYKKSLRGAFNTLRDKYDLIVVDAPGLMLSVDAALFASEADSVVLVIRAGSTRLETIEKAKAILKRSNSEALGAILNFRKFPVPKIFYG
jgi:capsular exopolysaccharide synthesis family protein